MRKSRLTAVALALWAASGGCSVESTDGVSPLATVRPAAQARKGPLPSFGETRRAPVPPPPISGGTLLVLRDGRAVAADPDRDSVFVVDLSTRDVRTVSLRPGDEPGRVLEDGEGRVHVVLRRGGAIATIDPSTATVLARREVCPAPRGIALDARNARALVVCEGGEVVGLPVDPSREGSVPTLLARIERDLRDIVVTFGVNGDRFFVSLLRSAEVLELSPTFAVVVRWPTAKLTGDGRQMLAMRMIPPPEADPLAMPIVVHSIARDPPPATTTRPTSYQGRAPADDPSDAWNCNPFGGPVVTTAISRVGIHAGFTFRAPDHASVPVDLQDDGAHLALVAAGNGHTARALPQVYVFTKAPYKLASFVGALCGVGEGGYLVHGQAIAVAFRRVDPKRRGKDEAARQAPPALVVQSREPAQLELFPEDVIIPLSSESREDTGHAIFHSNSGSGVACASCHAEAGDDGQAWTFDAHGPTRTPSLRGTLAGTAPFHWRGDLPDIGSLADLVMTGRMNGPELDAGQKVSLGRWLDSVPAPRAAPPSAAALRGRLLFEDGRVGCAACHSGPRLTNAQTVDVGTGGAFQVPSLVGLATRAPFLHNGCAPTLRDRFGPCGGARHGTTGHLQSVELDDLTAYLESL